MVEQDPRAGSEAEEGSTVTLTVSLGLAVKVPPTRGLSLDQARRRLEKADLLVQTREQASRGVDPGRRDLEHARRRRGGRVPVARSR